LRARQDEVGATGVSTETACKSCSAGKFSRVLGASSEGSCEIRNEMLLSSGAMSVEATMVLVFLWLLWVWF
jgi:hypothetical protein